MNSLILYSVIVAVLIAVILILVLIIKKQRKHKTIFKTIQRIGPEVGPALKDVSGLFNYNHYITESERQKIETKYADLYRKLELIHDCKELDGIPEKNDILRLYKALSRTKVFKVDNNEHFISRQLETHKEFFDTVLKYPLDPQQREAIVSLEDNVLVISSAGSGKTMTTVGKVRYLVDKQGVDPKNILLITFTRKSAESLSQRLGEKNLKCVTFHKLALDIIAEATGEKPTLTPGDFSVQVYQELLKKDKAFKQAITDYILRSRYKIKDQFEYDSMQEYMQDRKNYGVQAYYTDMDGRTVFCKSDEESQICDWLGGRGIKFRYEEKYEYPTVDKEHRQYTPDFSIYFKREDETIYRVYLEHFAVNEYGHCPKWFAPGDEQAYLCGIDWKRSVHSQNGTTLLETTSADFHKGDIFEKLEAQLIRCGVKFSFKNGNEVSHELEKQEQNILDMLTSFNFLMKSKAMTIEDVKAQRITSQDNVTINQIIAPFLKAYEQTSILEGEIDFTDIVIKATTLCNNGHRPDYDYILVDEFQDISMDRYRFLQSLRRSEPLTKLFCVGDDWQSIYRFAGSDMALFKSFSKFFGFTKECRMETTYRFGDPLIEKSSRFILTNPEQKEKKVRSFSDKTLTNIDFIPTNGKFDVPVKVKAIIDGISLDKSIYLLGRYSFDVNVLKCAGFEVKEMNGKVVVTYGKRDMTFMTVHQSKGLESDYVILLNCNSGAFGFPADIADNPILKYVLSEPDGYKFGEERRVFYVGITRAKIQTYVLYDAENPSPFVAEFVDVTDVEQKSAEKIPESELCPKCHCGRVETIIKGIAVNGNPYYVLGCSNQKFGCDYREMKFVNLNRKMRRR